MSTQTKHRRGTEAENADFTGAEGEFIYSTDTKRIFAHDALTQGGVAFPNQHDVHNNAFVYGVATGSANAIRVDTPYNPNALVPGMAVRVKLTASGVGAATLQWGTNDPKSIKKWLEGVKTDVAPEDLVAGAVEEFEYDGTDFIRTRGASGLNEVAQSDLVTSTGNASVNYGTPSGFNQRYILGIGCHKDSASYQTKFSALGGMTSQDFPDGWQRFDDRMTSVTLPGGEYGFYPQTRTATFSGPFAVGVQVQQRYVTSSPPYDIGDGNVGGFIFVLLNHAGDIVAHYSADAPPWAYNGPTNIRAYRKDRKTGKKYRLIRQKISFDEIMSGVKPEVIEQEITHKIKNADMGIIPHPFGTIPPGHKVVLLDPMSDLVKNMIDYQNTGGSEEIVELITSGFLRIDNKKLKRNCPRGVTAHAFTKK